MQKMRPPLDISFREFERIIQLRLYSIFGTRPGQVKILFVYADEEDISFFLKLIAVNESRTPVHVYLRFIPSIQDWVYDITDLPTMKKSIPLQMKS